MFCMIMTYDRGLDLLRNGVTYIIRKTQWTWGGEPPSKNISSWINPKFEV